MTVEEFVSGQFMKYVNNDGQCIIPKADAHPEFKEIFDKAQCLVHYKSLITWEQLMLSDIQGSRYSLYSTLRITILLGNIPQRKILHTLNHRTIQI